MQFSFTSQVSLSVAKISVDATPGLVGDIKQLLVKLLLSPSMYVKPCLTWRHGLLLSNFNCHCPENDLVSALHVW